MKADLDFSEVCLHPAEGDARRTRLSSHKPALERKNPERSSGIQRQLAMNLPHGHWILPGQVCVCIY